MSKKFSVVPLMKKMAPVLLSAVFLLPLSAHSEIKAGSVELSPFVGYNFFQDRQNLKNQAIFGGRVGYNFTQHFGVEGTGEFIKTHVDDKSEASTREGQFTSPIDSVRITMYHLDLVYHFIPEGKFNPFIVAGYGAAHYNPKINNRDMAVFDFGLGAKYWVADNIALRADVRDNLVYDERIHNIQATAGVVFAFGGGEKKSAISDTTPPTVIYTAPIKGATSVALSQQPVVAFSEDMDPATITAKTFTLKQGATPVSGKVSSSAAIATFTPASDFEKNKAYTATITTGAKDPAGNALASNYEWVFSTGSIADTTAPTVILTSPLKGAIVAPGNQKTSVAFSEAMDPASINAATFTLKQGVTPVPGKVSSSTATATFAPTSDLEQGKVYTGTITTGVKDLAGNPLASNYGWDFTTTSAEPAVVPCVLNKLEGSHFLFNSAEITENGKTILNLNAQVLKDNPKTKVRIEGYTSASGTEEYNQRLSEDRANAVKDYLVNVGGIDSNRLSTIGYGEANPAVYEADPSDINSDAAHANMRVLFEVVDK